MSQVFGSKGWHSGESARLSPMWPRFKSWCRGHMWVEFVVGSLLCSERFFSGYSGFPSPQKPAFPNSNSTRNEVDEEPLCGCATSKSLYIYLFIYYLFVNRWELRRLKNGEVDALQKHSKVLELQSETLIDSYYTFLFFKSPSLWFKSLLEFKKAFIEHFKIMACIYPASGNLTDNPELGTRWFPTILFKHVQKNKNNQINILPFLSSSLLSRSFLRSTFS